MQVQQLLYMKANEKTRNIKQIFLNSTFFSHPVCQCLIRFLQNLPEPELKRSRKIILKKLCKLFQLCQQIQGISQKLSIFLKLTLQIQNILYKDSNIVKISPEIEVNVKQYQNSFNKNHDEPQSFQNQLHLYQKLFWKHIHAECQQNMLVNKNIKIQRNLLNEQCTILSYKPLKFTSYSCATCIPFFFLNKKIDPTLLIHPNIIFLEKDYFKKTKTSQLVQWLSAFANSRGGVLFGGIDPTTHQVTGLGLTREQQLQFKKDLQRTCSIQPKNYILKINAITVFQSQNLKKLVCSDRCVMRISLQVTQNNVPFYYKKERKPLGPAFNFYRIDKNKQKKMIEVAEIYNFILYKYKDKRKLKNIHYGIECLPYQLYKNYAKEESSEKQSEEKLDFKFKYQSLVSFNLSSKNYFQILQKKMKEKHFKYTMMKPYLSLQKQCGLEYWLVSHEAKIEQITSLINKYTESKVKYIKFRTITKEISIADPFIYIQEFKKMQKKYMKKFGRPSLQNNCKELKSNNLNKKLGGRLYFSNFDQSIFTVVYIQTQSKGRCLFQETQTTEQA